jgi:hypothetical protein
MLKIIKTRFFASFGMIVRGYFQGKGGDKNSRKQSRIELADANHLR